MQSRTCASKDNSLLKSVSFSVKVLACRGETFNESLIVTAPQVQQFASCWISSGKIVDNGNCIKTLEKPIFLEHYCQFIISQVEEKDLPPMC